MRKQGMVSQEEKRGWKREAVRGQQDLGVRGELEGARPLESENWSWRQLNVRWLCTEFTLKLLRSRWCTLQVTGAKTLSLQWMSAGATWPYLRARAYKNFLASVTSPSFSKKQRPPWPNFERLLVVKCNKPILEKLTKN